MIKFCQVFINVKNLVISSIDDLFGFVLKLAKNLIHLHNTKWNVSSDFLQHLNIWKEDHSILMMIGSFVQHWQFNVFSTMKSVREDTKKDLKSFSFKTKITSLVSHKRKYNKNVGFSKDFLKSIKFSLVWFTLCLIWKIPLALQKLIRHQIDIFEHVFEG